MPEGRICLGCGTLVVGMTAQRCAPCERAADVQRVEERKAYGRTMKDTGHRARRRRKVYDSPAWKATRARVIARDGGACRLCGSTVRLTVHHIVPAADDDAAALDMDNLVTLCAACHGRIDGPKAARAKAAARARRRRRPRIIGNRGVA